MHIIILTNFCMACWKIIVIVIAITCVYHSMNTYLGTWCIFFKWSGSDSTDKEGRISTMLKSVLCSFFLRLPLFGVFFLKALKFFFFLPLNNFLFRQQEADTEAREKHSARSGLYELAWYRPLKFKRSSYFAAGSYSRFVDAMRAAHGHGNKPGGCSLSWAAAFWIMNGVIFYFCNALYRAF